MRGAPKTFFSFWNSCRCGAGTDTHPEGNHRCCVPYAVTLCSESLQPVCCDCARLITFPRVEQRLKHPLVVSRKAVTSTMLDALSRPRMSWVGVAFAVADGFGRRGAVLRGVGRPDGQQDGLVRLRAALAGVGYVPGLRQRCGARGWHATGPAWVREMVFCSWPLASRKRSPHELTSARASQRLRQLTARVLGQA
jgi:hypothetical protein